jgi:hypothetical protein
MTTSPGSEFVKQLIALLASSGGIVSLPLSELEQLGVEITLSNLASPAAIVTIRLGAKLYYVPAKEQSWQSIPPASPMEDPIAAVNELNNRPRKQRPQPQLDLSPDATPVPPTVEQHQPIKKGEIDLWIAEQRRADQLDRRQARLNKEAKQATRQYPWENRK